MGEVTVLRRPAPHVLEVCGLLCAEVDGEWWAFRPGSPAWRRRTGTFWRPVVGPLDSQAELEREVRRRYIAAVNETEVDHGT